MDLILWTEVSPLSIGAGEVPVGRRSPGLALAAGRIFVHGGYGGSGCAGSGNCGQFLEETACSLQCELNLAPMPNFVN